jgi:transcriptional regulator with XRE-family HTH domain
VSPTELRARRNVLGLTQAGLAAMLGVSPNQVARWERGERGWPAYLELALAAIEAWPLLRRVVSYDDCLAGDGMPPENLSRLAEEIFRLLERYDEGVDALGELGPDADFAWAAKNAAIIRRQEGRGAT